MLRTSLVLLALAASLSAQVSMTLVGTVDVSSTANGANPHFIGSNPTAVAWNGTDLFVAGYNASGAPGTAAITKVTTPLTTPVFSPAFGIQAATPNIRGYTGLDITSGILVASYDPGSAVNEGITGWDLNGNSLWQRNGRGSSGVAIDPGFGGVDFGAGWTTFGSGRRALQNQLTGSDLYTSANGAIFNPTPSPGTTWRDMDFDDLTGDVWLRMGNKVVAATRSAGNTFVNQRVVVDATLATTIIAQNLAFVRQFSGEVVFWNERSSTPAGQPFTTSVRCSRAVDGSDIVVDWGTFVAPAGVGAYDFSYDNATGTLAISDFNARQVHIFRVSIFETFGTGCPGQGGITPTLAAGGSAWGPGAINFTLANAAPLSIGLFVFGNTPVSVPLPFGAFCPLHVAPVLLLDGFFITGPGGPGSGSGAVTVPVPLGASGFNLAVQGAMLENGDLNQAVTSNGVFVVLP
jgi:hypothetical protein